MSPSQLVSASQKHMFKGPLDSQGGEGASPCAPAQGLPRESYLARNYSANRWEEERKVREHRKDDSGTSVSVCVGVGVCSSQVSVCEVQV